MLCEYPTLKSDLKYIKALIKKDEYRFADNHMYYLMHKIGLYDKGVVEDLADDLNSIQQTINQLL